MFYTEEERSLLEELKNQLKFNWQLWQEIRDYSMSPYKLRDLHIRLYHSMCDAKDHEEARLYGRKSFSDSPVMIRETGCSLSRREKCSDSSYVGIYVDEYCVSVICIQDILPTINEKNIHPIVRVFPRKFTLINEIIEFLNLIIFDLINKICPFLATDKNVDVALVVSDIQTHYEELFDHLVFNLSRTFPNFRLRAILSSSTSTLVAGSVRSLFCLVGVFFGERSLRLSCVDRMDNDDDSVIDIDFEDLMESVGISWYRNGIITGFISCVKVDLCSHMMKTELEIINTTQFHAK
ncbi:hypothetical protein ACOME3_007093 [Neoechinorhynchus agilis]